MAASPSVRLPGWPLADVDLLKLKGAQLARCVLCARDAAPVVKLCGIALTGLGLCGVDGAAALVGRGFDVEGALRQALFASGLKPQFSFGADVG